MLNTQAFATLTIQPDLEADPVRPIPQTPGEFYLVGLLDSQKALLAALNALKARVGKANGKETAVIETLKGNIDADYLKLDAMVGAYLSSGAIYKNIDQLELDKIRAILDRLQSQTDGKASAQKVLDAVVELLTHWSAPR